MEITDLITDQEIRHFHKIYNLNFPSTVIPLANKRMLKTLNADSFSSNQKTLSVPLRGIMYIVLALRWNPFVLFSMQLCFFVSQNKYLLIRHFLSAILPCYWLTCFQRAVTSFAFQTHCSAVCVCLGVLACQKNQLSICVHSVVEMHLEWLTAVAYSWWISRTP